MLPSPPGKPPGGRVRVALWRCLGRQAVWDKPNPIPACVPAQDTPRRSTRSPGWHTWTATAAEHASALACPKVGGLLPTPLSRIG